MNSGQNIYLPELYESLQEYVSIDCFDWHLVARYATKWKLSMADALFNMRVADEISLAKALAKARRLPYWESKLLVPDPRGLTFECIEDLMNVGALPIAGHRLAICNPYDDHRGLLRPELAGREMVVTERTPLYDELHKLCMSDWQTPEPSLPDGSDISEASED
jgi:hypothetical protein